MLSFFARLIAGQYHVLVAQRAAAFFYGAWPVDADDPL